MRRIFFYTGSSALPGIPFVGWLGHEKLAATFGTQWAQFPWGWLTICGLFFWAGYLVWDWTSATPRLRLTWPWAKVAIKFEEHFGHIKIGNSDVACINVTVKFRHSLTKASVHVGVSYLVWYIDGTGKWSEDSDVLIKTFDGDNPSSFTAPVYFYRNERKGGENGVLMSNRYIGTQGNWHAFARPYHDHYKIKVKVVTGKKVYEESVLLIDPNHTWSTPVVVNHDQIERFLLLPKGARAIPVEDKEEF